MVTFVLTGVKPNFKRAKFMEIVLEYVTPNVQDANAFVNAVVAGQTRFLTAPSGQQGIIATELDVAGVIWHMAP